MYVQIWHNQLFSKHYRMQKLNTIFTIFVKLAQNAHIVLSFLVGFHGNTRLFNLKQTVYLWLILVKEHFSLNQNL